MTKPDIQRIALKLCNQGINNDFEIEFSSELDSASHKDIQKCIDYAHEIFRTGKTEFKKKYCIIQK